MWLIGIYLLCGALFVSWSWRYNKDAGVIAALIVALLWPIEIVFQMQRRLKKDEE